jgi:hypothetical protein
MYTKESFWNSVVNEIRIIKHLATKVDAEKLDYKPTPSQRTTLELLQYLSVAGSYTIKAILEENKETYKEFETIKAGVTLENFASRMDDQQKEMRDIFEQFTDEDFLKTCDYYAVRTKGEHFIEAILKMFAAYRMQLFLYVKSCGAHVTTYDLWMGIDTPSK